MLHRSSTGRSHLRAAPGLVRIAGARSDVRARRCPPCPPSRTPLARPDSRARRQPSIQAPLPCRVYPPKTSRTASGRLRPHGGRDEIGAGREHVGPLGCEPAATEPALPCACLFAGAASALGFAQKILESLRDRRCSNVAANPPVNRVAHHF